MSRDVSLWRNDYPTVYVHALKTIKRGDREVSTGWPEFGHPPRIGPEYGLMLVHPDGVFSKWELLFHKPSACMRVGLEEVEQLFGHFLATGVAGMRTVAGQVAALPN